MPLVAWYGTMAHWHSRDLDCQQVCNAVCSIYPAALSVAYFGEKPCQPDQPCSLAYLFSNDACHQLTSQAVDVEITSSHPPARTVRPSPYPPHRKGTIMTSPIPMQPR